MKQPNSKKKPSQILFHYIKPYKNLFILDMLSVLFISLIDLFFPLVSRYCMYTLVPNNNYMIFIIAMISMLVVYIIRTAFSYIMWYYGHRAGISVETDIRKDLFAHIQTLGYDYFDENRVGHLLSRLTTDLFDIGEIVHHGPEDVFMSVITLGGALILMFRIEWHLALVITILLPIFILVVLKCRKNMRDASREVKVSTAIINADFESGLSGFRTAKAFANEKEEMVKFTRSNKKYRSSKNRFYNAMAVFNSTMEFFISVLSLTIIALGGLLVMRNKMNFIDLVTFSLYITTFVSPIRRLSVTAELFANGSAGFSRFYALMNIEPTIKDSPNAYPLSDVKGNINIKDVSFSYKEGEEVLHNISLEIKSGETIAFVGASGSGKTTLSKLIPRFYDVKQGEILIDGANIKNFTQDSLHQNIGVVSQDVFLFAAPIRENIRYGRLNATDEEIEWAAKKAEIYDDIINMENGFDTNVGERGSLLSGGQKQRISIARIFLKNPPILILDEATSALDSITEAKIQKTFEELSSGRTTIVIAHRLSTIKNATEIAVIDKGCIVEKGTHNDLMSKNGEYANLVKAQQLQNEY